MRTTRGATRLVKAGLATVALTALGACSVYDPALVDAPKDAGAQQRRLPPERPPTSTEGESMPEVAFAMRDSVLGDKNVGYDVDGLVTGPPNNDVECTTAGGTLRDGPGGLDNVFADNLFPIVDSVVSDALGGSLEDEARQAQEDGIGTPIARITDWNGEANDPQVTLEIVQAVFGMPGVAGSDPPTVAPPEEEWAELRPDWEGEPDWFWARTDAYRTTGDRRAWIRDPAAYVTNRVLVARVPDRIEIKFPAGRIGVSVYLTGAIVSGEISEDGQSLTNVVVAGRWAEEDLLATAPNVGICEGTATYDALVTALGSFLDVNTMRDVTGDPPCTALSMGVQFTGRRVRVAGLVDGPDLPNACASMSDAGVPDGGTRDAGDVDVDAGVRDAGPEDAGPEDAGETDAGDEDVDAGEEVDAGS